MARGEAGGNTGGPGGMGLGVCRVVGGVVSAGCAASASRPVSWIPSARSSISLRMSSTAALSSASSEAAKGVPSSSTTHWLWSVDLGGGGTQGWQQYTRDAFGVFIAGSLFWELTRGEGLERPDRGTCVGVRGIQGSASVSGPPQMLPTG